MKFCDQCGTQLPDEALFCEMCGNRVEIINNPVKPAYTVPANTMTSTPVSDVATMPVNVNAVTGVNANIGSAPPSVTAKAVNLHRPHTVWQRLYLIFSLVLQIFTIINMFGKILVLGSPNHDIVDFTAVELFDTGRWFSGFNWEIAENIGNILTAVGVIFIIGMILAGLSYLNNLLICIGVLSSSQPMNKHTYSLSGQILMIIVLIFSICYVNEKLPGLFECRPTESVDIIIVVTILQGVLNCVNGIIGIKKH